jgi:Ser/Thr protein kinase RdoA (MazF antagonist)
MNDATLPMATVSHSVLHPDFLAAEVSRRYALGDAMTGFLLYRGMNDVYLISNGHEKFALRVWRKTWRAVDDVAYELNFLDFLRQLYTWAPGKKFGEMLSESTAEKIGSLFAQMHLLGLEHAGSRVFSTDDAVSFDVNMPALLDFVYDRPEDLRDYPIIAERLTQRLRDIRSENVPMGIGHRDFHPSNVHVTESGEITLLDFDAAGEEYLMQDVKNFVWGNLFYGYSDAYGSAFERGYQTVRPFTPDELRHGELFLLAKAFRLVAGMAHSSVSVGRGTLRFRNMDWLGHYIKSRARPLGLL